MADKIKYCSGLKLFTDSVDVSTNPRLILVRRISAARMEHVRRGNAIFVSSFSSYITDEPYLEIYYRAKGSDLKAPEKLIAIKVSDLIKIVTDSEGRCLKVVE